MNNKIQIQDTLYKLLFAIYITHKYLNYLNFVQCSYYTRIYSKRTDKYLIHIYKIKVFTISFCFLSKIALIQYLYESRKLLVYKIKKEYIV